MKRLIALEGCDRTGKSTFISKLQNEIKRLGYIPFVFHLMGPTKFNNLKFDNDDKSLIQLSKFNDELDLFREMLNSNEKVVIILDRSHFGEYVWTKYWNRVGKYTDYLFTQEFFERHNDLFQNMLYINFYVSNVDILVNRIASFEEDTKIFTDNGKTIKENVFYVYQLFSELLDIVKRNNILNMEIDNSGTIIDLDKKIWNVISNCELKITYS